MHYESGTTRPLNWAIGTGRTAITRSNGAEG